MKRALQSIWEGIKLSTGGARTSVSLFPLWLWLYAALTALSLAMALPAALFAGFLAERDPLLATGPLWRWLEVLVFEGWPYLPLASGALLVALLGWVGGCFLAGGVAGVVGEREKRGEKREKRGQSERDALSSTLREAPLGSSSSTPLFPRTLPLFSHSSFLFSRSSAAVRLFWVSLLGGLLSLLALLLSLFLTALAFGWGLGWGLAVGALLGLFSLLFAVWAALARSIRLHDGVGAFRACGRAFLKIGRRPGRALGVALFLGVLAILFGVLLGFLLYGGLFWGGWGVFVLQQLWVLLRVGLKVSVQATADRWVGP